VLVGSKAVVLEATELTDAEAGASLEQERPRAWIFGCRETLLQLAVRIRRQRPWQVQRKFRDVRCANKIFGRSPYVLALTQPAEVRAHVDEKVLTGSRLETCCVQLLEPRRDFLPGEVLSLELVLVEPAVELA